MLNKIIHATIYTPDQILSDQTIVLKEGKIQAISPSSKDDPEEKSTCFNAEGLIVAPGLIDIHTHGAMGSDTMDATQTALETMSTHFSKHGVTSFYATTLTNSEEAILAALETVRNCSNLPGACLLGAHIEGPYINIEQKGAQNPDFFRPPQPEEYAQWFENGAAKLITIAPEIKGMDRFISECTERGIELAIGHSSATYEQVIHAADLGARQATHLFNGMTGLHHREPGTAGGILMDNRIYAQMIVDGIHLHPAIVKLAVQVKGIERSILISDAMRATGLDNGVYDLGGQAVTVEGGVARIANGSLAGSTLTLDTALRNTMQFCSLELQQVLPMATRVPAQAMHIYPQKGAVQVGSDADLVIFDKEYQVVKTIVGGKEIFL